MDLHIQSSVLFYFTVVHIYSILGQDPVDYFPVSVTIDPTKAVKGANVTFTCEFTLINGKDLHLLYWERTDGKRIFTYNHEDNEEKEHEPYKTQKKLRRYEYFNDGGDKRRHELEMQVDHCDRATFRCLVLNQDDFEEGSHQKSLEIQPDLPEPTFRIRDIDGQWYYDNATICHNGTTVNRVSCSVRGSSVRPKFRVTRNGAVINENSTTESLDHCLYNGDFTFYEEIVIGVEETFECVVSYGERDESREIRFTCIDPQDTTTDSGDGETTAENATEKTLQIVIPIIVVGVVLVLAAVIFCCCKKRGVVFCKRREKRPKTNEAEILSPPEKQLPT